MDPAHDPPYLVDTSAWVEYLRATGSPANLEVRRLLRDVAENRAVGDVTTLADSSVMNLISEGLSAAKPED